MIIIVNMKIMRMILRNQKMEKLRENLKKVGLLFRLAWIRPRDGRFGSKIYGELLLESPLNDRSSSSETSFDLSKALKRGWFG